jgi:hypothetical protein
MNQEDLQKLEDAYLERLNKQLQGPPGLSPFQGWDWPTYGVKSVSAVVIGFRNRQPPAGAIEVVYLVTINSSQPIPHAGQATREATGAGNSYTFVQLAASVASNGYETQLLSTYVGANPYQASPPAPSKKAGAPQPKAVSFDDPPTLPHPPP